MADEHVISHLSKYANVVSVRRLTYRNFPAIETGVRAYKLNNVRPTALPNIITVGPYHIMVEHVSRQYVRRCFRFNHLVKPSTSLPFLLPISGMALMSPMQMSLTGRA